VTHVVQRAVARAPRRVRDGIFEALVRGMTISAARGVTPSARFALNEIFLRRGVRRYRLRRSNRTVFVRHPVFDAWVIHEVINSRVYLPPPPVAHVLEHVGSPRIVDLGAHIGTATLLMLEQFPTAHILAVEPQPDTAQLLRRMVEANGLGGQCEVLEAAAGVADGTAAMEGFSLLAHFVRAETEEAVDLLPPLRKYDVGRAGATDVAVVDVLPLLDGADVVKLDIEGAEWPILQDPRFAALGISSLVLEYHPQGAPDADTLAAVRRVLGDAGFTVGDPVEEHGSVGVVWAWRD
jgi:FkbM family methyltransferase